VQHKHLQFGRGFNVVLGDEHSQAAQMTLGPGESEGGPENRHRGADQWLYVVSGTGAAVVGGERVELREGRSCSSSGATRTRPGTPATVHSRR
jgi:mannose-6-phosphate isomerase-like protein (cupin superfamily)